MTYEQGTVMIANMALTAMGLRTINSMDQDNDSASLLKLYYPIVLRRILSEYDWNFARQTKNLLQVVNDVEYKNYEYTFQLPDHFVSARRVRPEQAYWEIYDNSTLCINTVAYETIDVLDPDDYEIINQEERAFVELTYTRDDIDPMKMNAGFSQYLAFSLADEVSYMLTSDMNVSQMVLSKSNAFQAIAQVEDSTNTRMKERTEKKPWYRDLSEYYSEKYRDGGPNATEDFIK